MTLHMLKPKNKQKYFRQRVVRDLGTTKSFCLDKMTQEKKKKKRIPTIPPKLDKLKAQANTTE